METRMVIKASPSVSLIKAIKQSRLNRTPMTLCIAQGFKSKEDNGHVEIKAPQILIELDKEDLEYLYSKYKTKAISSLEEIKKEMDYQITRL